MRLVNRRPHISLLTFVQPVYLTQILVMNSGHVGTLMRFSLCGKINENASNSPYPHARFKIVFNS